MISGRSAHIQVCKLNWKLYSFVFEVMKHLFFLFLIYIYIYRCIIFATMDLSRNKNTFLGRLHVWVHTCEQPNYDISSASETITVRVLFFPDGVGG